MDKSYGQNRQSDVVASESLLVIVFFLHGVISVSSCHQVFCFVILFSSWCRRLLCFVVLFSSWYHSSPRRRVLRFINDGRDKSAVTQFFPVSTCTLHNYGDYYVPNFYTVFHYNCVSNMVKKAALSSHSASPQTIPQSLGQLLSTQAITLFQSGLMAIFK